MKIDENIPNQIRRDTVASVGVVRGRTLPFISSNKAIKTFRHALSLDEVGPNNSLPGLSHTENICIASSEV